MIPVTGYIRGTVRSLTTGNPVAGATVDAQYPLETHNLAIISGGSNASGNFELRVMAYDSYSRPNYLDGIPGEAQDPMVQFFGPSPGPRTDVVLVVRAPGYAEFTTRSRFRIPLLSSVDPNLIHTSVDVGLPDVASARTGTFHAAINDSGLVRRWMGKFLSPEELADPTIAGPSADPDGDGVVNRVECVYFSDPTTGTSVPQGVLTLRRANRMVRVNGVRHPNSLGGIEFLQARYCRRFREAVSQRPAKPADELHAALSGLPGA
jgi:hypothetical protein